MPFQFRLIPALAVAMCVALFVYLGLWQATKGDRLAQVLAQRAERSQLGSLRVGAQMLDAQAVQDAPLRVVGTFDVAHQIFLDNRQEAGQPGVHVITPLKIEGSDSYILVNRGWAGWPLGRAVLPQVSTPEGRVEIEGIASVPSTRKFFLMPEHADEKPNLWSRVDLPRYQTLIGHPLQPVVLQQTSADGSDKLVRHWPAPDDRVGMHRGYAFQWYGMAVVVLVLALLAGFRAGRKA
jgi:surfeit locus 1 family protein